MRYFKELSLDVIIYAFSIIIPKLSLFFLIPILTRVLMPSVYGYIDLLSNLSGIFGVFLIFGMDHSFAHQYGKAKSNDAKKIIQRQLFGNRIIQIGLFLTIVLIISYLFKISGCIGNVPYGVILIVIVATATMSLFIFGLETLRLRERKKDYVILAIIQVIMTITLILLMVVHLKWALFGYFLAWFISYCITILIFYLIDKNNMILPIFNWHSYKQTLSTSIPFLPSQLMPWCILGIAELAILILVSEHAMGIFAVSARLVLFLSNTVEVIRRSVWPRLLNMSKRHEDKLVFLIKSFLVLSLIGVMVISMMTPLIFEIIVGEAFQASAQIFPFLCFMVVGLAFNYLVGLNFIQRDKMSYFWGVYCATLIPIIIGSAYFIKMAGLIGVSYLIIIGGVIGNISAISMSSFNQKYRLFMWYGFISTGMISYLFIM
ncbi:MAG: oligosaccharide flippase family protein [Gammaproteobacteria bacterium]|nr:oligosaccharide flippase family protein [Gammaproteobacteria bacterium]